MTRTEPEGPHEMTLFTAEGSLPPAARSQQQSRAGGKDWWPASVSVCSRSWAFLRGPLTVDQSRCQSEISPEPLRLKSDVGKGGHGTLTWQGRHHDHEGGFPGARLAHCTPHVLTPASSPNVGTRLHNL